jgi:hypothetical protein
MNVTCLWADAGRPEQDLSIFDPLPPSAESIRDLGFSTLAVTGAIFALVVGILIYTLYRFRHGRSPWLICISLLAAGCDLPGKPDPKDRPIPAEKVLVFEALYNRNCAGCHGKDGKQGPAPPLNDPLFRAIVPVTDLEMVLSAGRPGTAMAPFAHGEGGPLSAAGSGPRP